MKTFAQWVIALTRGYIKATGKEPDKLAKLKINMEAGQKVKDQEKIIQFPQEAITDWRKPRPGEAKVGELQSGIMKATESKPTAVKTEAQIKSQIEKQNKESIANINRQMIEEDRAIKDMYRTSGPRDLETDSSFLASFIAEDAGKFLDDLPIAEQNKFIKRAENALRRNVKQYQGKKADVTELDDPLINEFAGPPHGYGAGHGTADSIQAQRIRQGFSTQSKLNSWAQNQKQVSDFIGRKNAEFNFLKKEDQTKVLEMFETQIKKHMPKEPLAYGGIAGMLGE